MFLVGVDLGITPLGSYLGERIVKMNRLWVIVIAGLILGFVITIAEPGLLVYAQQIDTITQGLVPSFLLLMIVSIGIATSLVGAFMRIIYNVPLHYILTVLYGIVFVFAIVSQSEFVNIAFDASGATTGVLAVPFILSLAYGISHLKKDTKAGEKDAFGTIAIVSAGAIISVLVINVFSSRIDFVHESLVSDPIEGTVFSVFLLAFIPAFRDTFFALIPLLIILFISQFLVFKMRLLQFIHVVKGFIYVFLGLLLFLLGVNGGFLEIGTEIGKLLITEEMYGILLIVAFIIGVATILAEPARCPCFNESN